MWFNRFSIFFLFLFFRNFLYFLERKVVVEVKVEVEAEVEIKVKVKIEVEEEVIAEVEVEAEIAEVEEKVKALLISLLKFSSSYDFIIFIFSSVKGFDKRYKSFGHTLAFVKFILDLIFLNLINDNIIFILIKKK